VTIRDDSSSHVNSLGVGTTAFRSFRGCPCSSTRLRRLNLTQECARGSTIHDVGRINLKDVSAVALDSTLACDIRER
jgi:hypothetical protein